MHIYNWYHSDITGIHYVHENVIVYYRAIPLLSASPFPLPFCSPSVSLYLLGTLLAVIGSRPPRSQVARKLIFPFPSPYPYTPHSKFPTPWGLPDPNIHTFIRTTSRTWLTRSSTRPFQSVYILYAFGWFFKDDMSPWVLSSVHIQRLLHFTSMAGVLGDKSTLDAISRVV
jgi:hypothetical protein